MISFSRFKIIRAREVRSYATTIAVCKRRECDEFVVARKLSSGKSKTYAENTKSNVEKQKLYIYILRSEQRIASAILTALLHAAHNHGTRLIGESSDKSASYNFRRGEVMAADWRKAFRAIEIVTLTRNNCCTIDATMRTSAYTRPALRKTEEGDFSCAIFLLNGKTIRDEHGAVEARREEVRYRPRFENRNRQVSRFSIYRRDAARRRPNRSCL